MVGAGHASERAAEGQRVSTLHLICDHVIEVRGREGDLVDTFALLGKEARNDALLVERRSDLPLPVAYSSRILATTTLTVDLAWWPLDPYDEMPEQRVHELFARLRTLTPPLMREGERRSRTVVGPDEPIDVDHLTFRRLAGRRPGQIGVLQIIHLSADHLLEAYARFAIGLRQDRTIMVTPNLNPATHLVCELWDTTRRQGY